MILRARGIPRRGLLCIQADRGFAAFVAALRKADFEMTEDWEVAIECLEWGVAIRQIAFANGAGVSGAYLQATKITDD